MERTQKTMEDYGLTYRSVLADFELKSRFENIMLELAKEPPEKIKQKDFVGWVKKHLFAAVNAMEIQDDKKFCLAGNLTQHSSIPSWIYQTFQIRIDEENKQEKVELKFANTMKIHRIVAAKLKEEDSFFEDFLEACKLKSLFIAEEKEETWKIQLFSKKQREACDFFKEEVAGDLENLNRVYPLEQLKSDVDNAIETDIIEWLIKNKKGWNV